MTLEIPKTWILWSGWRITEHEPVEVEMDGKKPNPDPGGKVITAKDHAQLTTGVAGTSEVGAGE